MKLYLAGTVIAFLSMFERTQNTILSSEEVNDLLGIIKNNTFTLRHILLRAIPSYCMFTNFEQLR